MMTKEMKEKWKEIRLHSQNIEEAIQRMEALGEAVGDSEVRRYVFGLKHLSAMICMRLDVVAQEEIWRKS